MIMIMSQMGSAGFGLLIKMMKLFSSSKNKGKLSVFAGVFHALEENSNSQHYLGIPGVVSTMYNNDI